MPAIHDRIADAAYWEGNVNPIRATPALLYGADLVLCGASFARIDRTYRQVETHGSSSIDVLEPGKILDIAEPGTVLKVVQDVRTDPIPKRKDSDRHFHVDNNTFDWLARQMVDDTWYKGPTVSTTVESDQGVYDITRRTIYLTRGMFSRNLIGKDGILLNKGGDRFDARQLPQVAVGDIRDYSSRKRGGKSRIVSADAITPARQTRRGSHHRSLPNFTPKLAINMPGMA